MGNVLFLSENAMQYTAPPAPESAIEYMPEDTESFLDGLLHIIKAAFGQLHPAITVAASVFLTIIVIIVLCAMLQSISEKSRNAMTFAAAVSISLSLLSTTNTLIGLATDTVNELSEYGKLLLPVMTGALAAQGGITTSAALYSGTALFSSILSSVISQLIVPVVYIFLCLSVANSCLGDDLLKQLRDSAKKFGVWCLKTVLYVFTGYMSITGVITGTTDASALKATKLAISGTIPVVGGILSDASETILIGAGLMKNIAGVYGLLAMICIWIGPFLQIGVQYLLLNMTCAVCGVFGNKQLTDLLKDFSTAMGLLLAMTGAVCLLLLVSTVCFMKGMSQ